MLPTFGENFGHAIFEAFSAGRPVLISDQTPWVNLEKQKLGYDLPLDDNKDWIDTIERIAAMEQNEFEEFCTASLSFAQSYIEKKNLKEKYLEMFSV